MKKTLKKVFFTCAAVVALSAAMSVSAMAAISDATVTPSYANGAGSVTYSGTATANEQVTALVVKADAIKEGDTVITQDEILYIDQMQADAEGKFTFAMPLGTIADGTDVLVLGGGESVAADGITKKTVTIGTPVDPDPTYTLGDVNDDGEINGSDALAVARFDVGIIASFTDDEKAAADVNKDSEIDGSDALAIARFEVGIITDFSQAQ